MIGITCNSIADRKLIKTAPELNSFPSFLSGLTDPVCINFMYYAKFHAFRYCSTPNAKTKKTKPSPTFQKCHNHGRHSLFKIEHSFLFLMETSEVKISVAVSIEEHFSIVN